MSKLADCVIGLGANLGERRSTLQAAMGAIGSSCELRSVSSLYETAPIGPPQPDYLNAAVRVECALTLPELLALLLQVERSFGRVRTSRWGARTLDLDILWAGQQVANQPNLQVPHPRLEQRAFAILPLLDVAPSAADPRSGIAYVSVLKHLDVSGVRKLMGPEWAA